MNKLMKFCGKCEEGFAERFTFCPNCGGNLDVFEMSPVSAASAAAAPPAAGAEFSAPETPAILAAQTPESAAKTADVLEIPEFEAVIPAPAYAASGASGADTNGSSNDALVYSLPDEEITEEIPAAAVATPVAAAATASVSTGASRNGWREVKSVSSADDGGYHLTMVENHTFLNDPRLRAAGLFGIALVLSVTLGAFVYDLFKQNVYVAAVGEDDIGFAYIPVDPDASVEEIMEQLKTKDTNTGGGGGGGGGKDADPPKKGEPPAMSKTDPQFKPTTHDRSVTDPLMPINPAVWAPIDKAANGKVGAPKGGDKISDGTGGGGIGNNGIGGVGDNGRDGYGANGNRGIGGVPGGGIGNDRGDGTGRDGEPPPPPPAGPTIGVKLLSQPKPPYTEEARKNQINGTVVLRVTFNANGTIGAITPVKGLGYGLTENAIAAARRIAFEPAKRGGVPYTVTKPIQFTFTLY